MKQPFILFTLCLLSSAEDLHSKTFLDHFRDFEELVHEEVGAEISNLFGKYLEDDKMQTAVAFLENKQNLKNLLERLYKIEEFYDLTQFLGNNGVDHRRFLELPSNEIEYERSQSIQLRTATPQKTGIGYSGFIQDVVSLLPRDKLFDLHLEKMKNELSFRVTMRKLLSDEFWNLSWELRMTRMFSADMGRLQREYDINVNLLISYWIALLGFPQDVKE